MNSPRARAEARIDIVLTDGERRRDVPFTGPRHPRRRRICSSGLAQQRQRGSQRARGVASGSPANTLSQASSACSRNPKANKSFHHRSADSVTCYRAGTERPTPPRSCHGFQHQTFGATLADAGHRVSAATSPSASAWRSAVRVVDRQSGQGDLRPLHRNTEQLLEEVARIGVDKPVERHRIFPHDHGRDQARFSPALEGRERRRRATSAQPTPLLRSPHGRGRGRELHHARRRSQRPLAARAGAAFSLAW